MFRTITRILMIVVACAALVALAVTVKVGATGANPVAWMTSDSGPLAQGSNLSSASATATPDIAQNAQNPQNSQNAQDADGDGDSGTETSAAEDTQDNGQQAEQEQEMSGVVSNLDSANSTFTLTTSSGAVAVQVTSATQYEDGLSGLASLQSGMSVTVKGTAQAAGQMLATEVKGPSDTNATGGTDASSPDNGN